MTLPMQLVTVVPAVSVCVIIGNMMQQVCEGIRVSGTGVEQTFYRGRVQ